MGSGPNASQSNFCFQNIKASKSQKHFCLVTPLPKKQTKYLTKFCPCFVGQNVVLIFRPFWGQWNFKKNAFKIYWPLKSIDLTTDPKTKKDLNSYCIFNSFFSLFLSYLQKTLTKIRINKLRRYSLICWKKFIYLTMKNSIENENFESFGSLFVNFGKKIHFWLVAKVVKVG